ncbi:MAG: hypothetical protein KTR21_08815 [Rhodobacteraceae bacterium]|nr:hypothetical protein [Paracoccaceae bacterium]
MAETIKIASCCYCGARAALTLGDVSRDGFTRHELACANCGAPISMLKRLKVEAAPTPVRRPQPQRNRATPQPFAKSPRKAPPRKAPPKKKKRRSPKRRRYSFVEILDDLFDDLEDLFD